MSTDEYDEKLKKEFMAYIQIASVEYMNCIHGTPASSRSTVINRGNTGGEVGPINSNNKGPNKGPNKGSNNGSDSKETIKDTTSLETEEVSQSYIMINGASSSNPSQFNTEKESVSKNSSVSNHNKVWSKYTSNNNFNIINDTKILNKIKKGLVASGNKKIDIMNDKASFCNFYVYYNYNNAKYYARYSCSIIASKSNDEHLTIRCTMSIRQMDGPTGSTQVGGKGLHDSGGSAYFDFKAKRDKLYSYSSIKVQK